MDDTHFPRTRSVAREWPTWPQPAPNALRALERVLHSGRWSISGPNTGRENEERRFAKAFAAYCGVPHCVPATNGTASLLIALEACGIGAGDEVITPAISWVASASTIVSINAIPVFCDVNPQTLCIDIEAIEALITAETKAILVVHLYSSVADLDSITVLAERHGLFIIEDCSQAHGATYRHRKVGSYGHAGAFSMHHTKVLTCGEGGAAITNDAEIADRMGQLRSDGRRYPNQPPPVGTMELVPGDMMGSNRAMSEFHAAILIEQLTLLDAQNAIRANNAAELDRKLRQLEIETQQTSEGTTFRSYFGYAFALPSSVLNRKSAIEAASDLSAALGFTVRPIYEPIYRSALYRPASRRRFHISATQQSRLAGDRLWLPNAEGVSRQWLTFHHSALLGNEDEIFAIAAEVEALLLH